MLVELDIFSGRPNPRWQLDEQGAEALRELLSRLAATTDSPPEPPGLGYRGFLLTDETGKFRACGGYVTRPDGAYADPTSSVERFLRDRIPNSTSSVSAYRPNPNGQPRPDWTALVCCRRAGAPLRSSFAMRPVAVAYQTVPDEDRADAVVLRGVSSGGSLRHEAICSAIAATDAAEHF